jgi:hypothetical protein
VVLSPGNQNKQKSFFDRLRMIFALCEVQGAFGSSFDALRMLPRGMSASQGLREKITKAQAALDIPKAPSIVLPQLPQACQRRAPTIS